MIKFNLTLLEKLKLRNSLRGWPRIIILVLIYIVLLVAMASLSGWVVITLINYIFTTMIELTFGKCLAVGLLLAISRNNCKCSDK